MWINASDIILVGLRDYQDVKADVLLKYSSEEARNLKTYGEIPESGIHFSVCCTNKFKYGLLTLRSVYQALHTRVCVVCSQN